MSRSKTPIATRPLEVDQTKLATHLVRETARALLVTASNDPTLCEEQLEAAIEIVQSLAPADVLETQLIVQMVLSHTVATETLRQAAKRNDNPYIASLNMRDAARFMNLYRHQVKTLTHYRGTPRERKIEARLEAHRLRQSGVELR